MSHYKSDQCQFSHPWLASRSKSVSLTRNGSRTCTWLQLPVILCSKFNCKDYLPLRCGCHVHSNRYLQWIIRPQLNFSSSLNRRLALLLLKNLILNGSIALWKKNPLRLISKRQPGWLPWSKASLFLFLTKNERTTRATDSNVVQSRLMPRACCLIASAIALNLCEDQTLEHCPKGLYEDKWGR